MKKQPFVNFYLAGLCLTDFGLQIPSPLTSLEIANSETLQTKNGGLTTASSWTLNVAVSGSVAKKSNISAFEALLYSAAQEAHRYPTTEGVPVQFMFGWIDETTGNVAEYLSFSGFMNTFSVSTNGLYMNYKLVGFAKLDPQKHMPVLRIPSLQGIVQPSAVMEAVAVASKATSYYMLDIDHNDAPTLVNHGPLNTSLNSYVRGTYDSSADNYDKFPGLLPLSKSYNATREAAGIRYEYKSLNQIRHNRSVTPMNDFLRPSNTDTTPQCSSFSYWVTEPTMTSPGVIHYKSNANLQTSESLDMLEYGTDKTNVLSVNGTYNGVAYNMTNLDFRQVGFALDGSGNSISQPMEVVRSWSSTLGDVFQTSNILNDVNALASQFTSDFTVQVPGTTKNYGIAQPVSLLIMSSGVLSPVTGVYSITSVTHTISTTFVTTLKLKRFTISSANEVASSSAITVNAGSAYGNGSLTTTKNVKSAYKVDFGIMYPNFEHLMSSAMSVVD